MHAMMAFGRMEVIDPPILNTGTRYGAQSPSRPIRCTPTESALSALNEESCWVGGGGAIIRSDRFGEKVKGRSKLCIKVSTFVITAVIKCVRMVWAGHIACFMTWKLHGFKLLCTKRVPLGRTGCRWKDTIREAQ